MSYLLNNFKMNFSVTAEKAIEYREINDQELLVTLNDGSSILYDDMERAIRNLPKDRRNMSERECRHEFAFRLNKLMARKRMTQIQLSELTGISQPRLSNYLNGTNTPSLYAIDKLAKALGCSADEIRYF